MKEREALEAALFRLVGQLDGEVVEAVLDEVMDPSNRPRVNGVDDRLGHERWKRALPDAVPGGRLLGTLRAMRVEYWINRGCSCAEAAKRAGYPEQFTASNCVQRWLGVRPSLLKLQAQQREHRAVLSIREDRA